MKKCDICKGVGWVQTCDITLDKNTRHTINYEVWKECECQQPVKVAAPDTYKKTHEWWKD